MGRGSGGLYGRLAFTLLVPIAVFLLGQISLPGVNAALYEKILETANRPSFDTTLLIGPFALQLNQIYLAALLVEALALVIPRWRGWRLGGYPERERLWRRVKLVAAVTVPLQALFLVRWLHGSADAYSAFGSLLTRPHNLLLMTVQVLSLTAGTFLLLWLTRTIDTYGAGNGFSVMMVAFLAMPTVGAIWSSVQHRLANGDRVLMPLGLAAIVVVAITRLAGGQRLRAQSPPSGAGELPIPSSSLHPVVAAAGVLSIPASLAKAFDADLFPQVLLEETWTRRGVQVALIAGICLLEAWLFNRPRLVAEAWRRAGGVAPPPDDAQTRERGRSAFARGLAWSLVVCWAVAGADWLSADAELVVNTAALTVIACVAVDVAGEVRFRSRHGAVAAIWPVHRLYILSGMLKALEAAGIPAYARGRRHRTLWSFFLPYVPVDILVPIEHAQRAEEIVLPLASVR